MRQNNENDLTSFTRLLALLALVAGLVGMSQAQAAALQVDEPWETTGNNTGTVAGAPVTATSAGDRWLNSFNNDTALYPRTDLWGTNALPVGTIGDFFSLNFRANTTDTITITLGAPLTDPIFYIGDLDVVGSSVTVTGPTSGSNFTNNADSEWVGNTLTTLAGAQQERAGAFGTVQYLGTFAADNEFVFAIDYDFDTFASDNMAIGIGVIPLPPAVLLFGSALGLLGWLRRR